MRIGQGTTPKTVAMAGFLLGREIWST